MTQTRKADIARRFSKAAGRYIELANIQDKLASHALNMVSENKGRSLDIGCGTGQHSEKLGEFTIGLDLALGMLIEAKTTHSDARSWVNGDMDALPFANDCFETVFSSMAVQWTDSPNLVLNEIGRVLTSGGMATILVPVKGTFSQLRQAYERAKISARLNDLLCESVWLSAAQNAGLKLLNSQIIIESDSFNNLRALLGSISKIGAASSEYADHKALNRAALNVLAKSYQLNEQGQYCLDYRCLLIQVEK